MTPSSATNGQRISFFGLGAMGGGMASNLARRGFHVTGYDLSSAMVDSLVAAGGHSAPSPALAASAACGRFAVVMVATMYQADSVLFDKDGAAASLPRDSILLLCSTCPPSYPPLLRKRLDDVGRSDVKLLDCPVSGGTLRAAAGELSIFASGDADALHEAGALLNAMAKNLYLVPGGVSMGQKVKAVHQLLAATNIISASEAMGLAATVGLDTQAVFDSVSKGPGASFMLSNRGPHMLVPDQTVRSAVAIIFKDAGIVVDAARAIRHPVPLAAAAEQLYAMASAPPRDLLAADDARLVEMYLPPADRELVARLRGAEGRRGRSDVVSAQTVADLLAGIHLAASVEAMAYCKALEVERKLMCEIVSEAAGWCAMFTDHVPAMLDHDQWTLARCSGADAVRRRLELAVDACRTIGYPCQMGVTALHQYKFAALVE
ncbi:hypothetical protein ANO11243_029480 [Dothideomycetidae sp. 11243]|nr:hypothetical protein ANO11243_029480 [fungal sp. No.11243]